MNEKTHSSLLGLAGGYVLYLAYELMRDYVNGVGGMSDFLYIFFFVLLTLGGIAVLYYAWTCYRKSRKKEEEKDPEPEKETTNQLK